MKISYDIKQTAAYIRDLKYLELYQMAQELLGKAGSWNTPDDVAQSLLSWSSDVIKLYEDQEQAPKIVRKLREDQ